MFALNAIYTYGSAIGIQPIRMQELGHVARVTLTYPLKVAPIHRYILVIGP